MTWAEAYCRAKFQLDPYNRLATIHQRHRQTDRQDRQLSTSIGRTVLQPVAQKTAFVCNDDIYAHNVYCVFMTVCCLRDMQDVGPSTTAAANTHVYFESSSEGGSVTETSKSVSNLTNHDRLQVKTSSTL